MTNNYEEIYNQIKNDSIGSDKKIPYKKTKGKIAKAISIATITGVLVASALVGCSKGIMFQSTSVSSNEDYKYAYYEYGYRPSQIDQFEKGRLTDLLIENDITNYHSNDDRTKLVFNYDPEVFKSVSDLDESYFHALYRLTDTDYFNSILKVYGYDNLNDFLEKNKYLDENGQPSYDRWMYDNLEQQAKMMSEIENSKGMKK